MINSPESTKVEFFGQSVSIDRDLERSHSERAEAARVVAEQCLSKPVVRMRVLGAIADTLHTFSQEMETRGLGDHFPDIADNPLCVAAAEPAKVKDSLDLISNLDGTLPANSQTIVAAYNEFDLRTKQLTTLARSISSALKSDIPSDRREFLREYAEDIVVCAAHFFPEMRKQIAADRYYAPMIVDSFASVEDNSSGNSAKREAERYVKGGGGFK